jgi:hypothetical protein
MTGAASLCESAMLRADEGAVSPGEIIDILLPEGTVVAVPMARDGAGRTR